MECYQQQLWQRSVELCIIESSPSRTTHSNKTENVEVKLSWKAAESDFVFSGNTMIASNKHRYPFFHPRSQTKSYKELKQNADSGSMNTTAVHTEQMLLGRCPKFESHPHPHSHPNTQYTKNTYTNHTSMHIGIVSDRSNQHQRPGKRTSGLSAVLSVGRMGKEVCPIISITRSIRACQR